MFYLYLKTHEVTGLKYLGYTKQDPYQYSGSGLYWKRHLQENGNFVKTEVLFSSQNIDEISVEGLRYSKLWDVVNSHEFANLCEEDGNKNFGDANPNFRGHPQTEETRQKISANNGRGNAGKTGNLHPAYGHSVPEHIIAQSTKNLNEWVKQNGPWNKGKKVGPHSEETKRRMSEAASNKPTVTCSICGKEGKNPGMARYHFTNCKHAK